MKRKITMAVLIFLCFILQGTVGNTIAIGSVKPNLLIILVSSYALMRGKKSGMVIGFFCGLLMDIFYSDVIGINALIFVYVGFLNGYCYRLYYDDDIKTPIILIGISDLCYGIITYVIEFLLRGRIHFLFYLRRIIIPEVLYTIVITLIFYKIFFIINRKLEQKEQRSANNLV